MRTWFKKSQREIHHRLSGGGWVEGWGRAGSGEPFDLLCKSVKKKRKKVYVHTCVWVCRDVRRNNHQNVNGGFSCGGIPRFPFES